MALIAGASVRVYPVRAGADYVRGARWAVSWRTPRMPAPAFDYFRTKREADASAADFRRHYQAGSAHVVMAGYRRTRAGLVKVTRLASGRWRGTVIDEQGKPLEYQDFATEAAAQRWKRDEMRETHVGSGRARRKRHIGPVLRVRR